MATFQLEVNGQAVAAEYRDADVERVLLPLLDRIARCTERVDAACARTIVFIAAPPGAGKSTLAATMERLAEEDPRLPRMQAIGMDGFHFPNTYLDSHDVTLADGRTLPLRAIKGAPETFDVCAFIEKVRETRTSARPVSWPVYSRIEHDVVSEGITIDAPVVLVEGNYLLLNEEPWRGLVELADCTVFLDAGSSLLHERLVARKVRGGMGRDEAEAFFEASDGRNVERVRRGSAAADVRLQVDATGRIRRADALPAVAFFDVDGTLTWDHDDIPHELSAPTPAVRAAIERFVERGNIAVLCTGRPPISVSPAVLACPFAGKIMLASGHVEFDGEVIRERSIPHELICELVDVFERVHMPAYLETATSGITLSWPDVPSLFDDEAHEERRVDIEGVRALLAEPDSFKVAKIVFDTALLNRLEPAMPFIREHFVVSDLGIGAHEMTVPDINKFEGMRAIWRALRERGIEFGTVYGFGDSENDVTMLSAVDVAVVMGNALPAARACADYVTDAVQEDGVATALQHFGLA
ncbi:nucleoside/nucleotide kinase family protein [Enorma sp.]|uniref:nucleoside/nucleotide kinase family protein n=1 Tax=Enorma sp. TaxID=1920692 RepID=UPI003AB909F6